jgi:hypothetical protein
MPQQVAGLVRHFPQRHRHELQVRVEPLPFRLVLLLSCRLRRLQNSDRVDCRSMLDLALLGLWRRAIDILYVRPRTDDSASVKHTATSTTFVSRHRRGIRPHFSPKMNSMCEP